MSTTPLSDAITGMVRNPRTRAEFHVQFLSASLGVEAAGVPSGHAHGERIVVGPEVGFALVEIPDGRVMIKACADPPAFEARFPDAPITALVDGRELLRILLTSDELDGVVVCSAAANEYAVPIARDEAEFMLRGGAIEPRPARPWWKFWG